MSAEDDAVMAIAREADKELQKITDKIFATSQRNLIDEGKVDTGVLFKTANINRGFLWAEIVYPALYAEAVHNGRIPGTMPPVKSLHKWVKRKLGVKNDREIRNISWAIAKSIKERGIEPFPFLQRAIDKELREAGW